MLCGQTVGHINAAVQRMRIETLQTLITVGSSIFQMTQTGVTPELLNTTFTALSRIGLPFAKPSCDDTHVGPAV